MKGKIFCIPQTACHFPVFCQKYVGNFFSLFLLTQLKMLNCFSAWVMSKAPSLICVLEREISSHAPPTSDDSHIAKTPKFHRGIGGGGAAFLGESGTSVAKILGEVFCIFLPCLRTSKTANVHLRPRPYYSKYVLKLFFYSYTKGTAELAWIPETQTKKVSLTHHLDRKQERSIALDHTWARRRREETFPSVPHSHRNLSGGHNSYSAA